MIKKFCHLILFKWMGWHDFITVPTRKKCIICVAPHTSNWDFILAELYYTALGKHANFLMKKEWFFWPLNRFLKKIGGFPVYRNKKCSMTDQLATLAMREKSFQLAITPEGTRSFTTEWKKGFYYIALKAQLPIQLYAIDYKRKIIVCTKELFPTGDIEKDMKEIKLYYKEFNGKHPEKFSIGNIENE